MFFATVRFTVAKNPDKCPNLRTVGNYMSNCRKKRTSQKNMAPEKENLEKEIPVGNSNILSASFWSHFEGPW